MLWANSRHLASLNAFHLGNIDNVNDNPIDYIIDCAVRKHPDRKPAAVIILNFMAFPVQGVQDLGRCLEKVKPGIFDVMSPIDLPISVSMRLKILVAKGVKRLI